VFGSDGDGDVSVFDADYKRPCAVIIGSEGEGMGRLVRKECDFVLSIPMYGKTNSLNASAAAAVLLYSAVRIRNM